MDRGIVSEENLQAIGSRGGQYWPVVRTLGQDRPYLNA